MTQGKAADRRARLAREDRRMALLDAAAEVVEQEGWPALSMITVADRAGISRQLVYRHFASLDELMADTMSHLFRNRYEQVRRSLAKPDNDLADLVKLADAQTFDDPPARVRALWQMITSTYSANQETRRMGSRLRHLLIKLWTPTMSRHLELPEPQVRAVAWMLNMAFWGVHQLVDEGELSRKGAVDIYTWLLERVVQGASGAKRKPRN